VPNIKGLLKKLDEWLPYIIENELQKERVMRWLETSLQEKAASEEEERKTHKAASDLAILRGLFHPDYFKQRNLPERVALLHLARTHPELFRSLGLQIPKDIDQQQAAINEAVARMTIAREAGEPQQEEVVRIISEFMGKDPLEEAAAEHVKVKEAAKDRLLKGREIAVQEKLIPIREKETMARWKELEGQIGDMTTKEARAELADLGKERRRYQAQLQTKVDAFGEILSEEGINYIKSNIAEIKKAEDKINSKYSKDIEAEYKAIADDLKKKGHKAADLDEDEQIRSILIEQGINIEILKRYMK
jgi:ASC-1-like (ASCH) protein